jgi:hypothetical protein
MRTTILIRPEAARQGPSKSNGHMATANLRPGHRVVVADGGACLPDRCDPWARKQVQEDLPGPARGPHPFSQAVRLDIPRA